MILHGRDSEVADWYAAKLEIPVCPYHGAIGLLDENGVLRGAVLLTLVNANSAHSDIYSELPSLAPYARGVFSWMFEYTNRVTAVTGIKNKKMKRHLPRLGFEFEGRKKDWYGVGQDGLEFRMMRHNCKWIRDDGQDTRRARAA